MNDIEPFGDNLLLATEDNGLWLFDTRSALSKKIPVETQKQSYYLATFFQGNYYIYAPYQFYLYNPKTQLTKTISDGISISNLVSTKRNLYVANDTGLYQLNTDHLISVINEPIIAITEMTDAIVAITAGHIYKISDDGQRKTIAHNEKVHAVTTSSNSRYFFTVDNTGKISKYSSSTLEPVTHHYKNAKPVRVRNLFHDASGVLWLSSSHGIQQLSENYLKNHPVTFDIPINANEITLFDNEIIIGSYGAGLKNFISPVFEQKVNELFSEKGLTIYDLIDINGVLYIATLDGLWVYKKLDTTLVKSPVLTTQTILKLEHKKNKLYIGTNSDGLYIYDLNSKKITSHLNVTDGLSSNETIDILPIKNNELWIASGKKIDVFDSYTNKVKPLKAPNNSKVISLITTDNKVFASTLSDGILVFNLHGELLSQIAKGQSFTEMLVVGNEIWVSGKPGLYRLSPKNYQIKMIANTQQYSFVSSMLVKDDTLYAIHYSGILAIDLSDSNKFNPNVIISKTTISGQSYLLNKSINVESGNDVITLDLASLDFRPGLNKKYKYKINDNQWQRINNNQLTLTGLAPGDYHLEIMASNSVGEWSNIKAYTDIHVAYPWYWTVELRIFYGVLFVLSVLLTCWLVYLRTRSIKHIHDLLQTNARNYTKMISTLQRNLQLTSTSILNNDIEQSKELTQRSLQLLQKSIESQEPDSLAGKQLSIAIPFLADYVKNNYEVKLKFSLDEKLDDLHCELREDVYKIIFEALMSAILNSKAMSFNLSIQEVKRKLWLTIDCDNSAFNQVSSRINFDLADYTIRQITNRRQASLNTFKNKNGGSQLSISFPLMVLS